MLGAGISGLCAASSAAEAKAKVIVLEKRDTYTFHGAWNGRSAVAGTKPRGSRARKTRS